MQNINVPMFNIQIYYTISAGLSKDQYQIRVLGEK